MRTMFLVIIGCVQVLAIGLVNAQADSPRAGAEVFSRSEIVLAVVRVYEALAKERGADIDDWAFGLRWAEQHTAVNAAVVDTDDGKAVDVVVLGRATDLGGSRRFRVNLKSGAVLELGPDR